jgi:hypothetical protein
MSKVRVSVFLIPASLSHVTNEFMHDGHVIGIDGGGSLGIGGHGVDTATLFTPAPSCFTDGVLS